jgi:hypothetical protein
VTGHLRQQIAQEAARLLYTGSEAELGRARRRAALRLCRHRLRAHHLPSSREIREEEALLASHEHVDPAQAARWRRQLATLGLLRTLRSQTPRVADQVLDPHGTVEGILPVLVQSGDLPAAVALLEDAGIEHEPLDTGPDLLVDGVYQFRITGEALGDGSGFPPHWVTPAELEHHLAGECPWFRPGEAHLEDSENDQFWLYRCLLEPLADVKLDPREHPEGDALYHSLQVYDLACREQPYDQELLLAALLHLVGYPVNRVHHAEAALEVLDGTLSPRTALLIQHLPAACQHQRGELTGRARRQLLQIPELESLLVLADCDRRGRVPGAPVPELERALEHLQELGEL